MDDQTMDTGAAQAVEAEAVADTESVTPAAEQTAATEPHADEQQTLAQGEAAAQSAQEAAAADAPAAEGQPAAAQEEKHDDQADVQARIDKAHERLVDAELRSAAVLAGVPKERLPYVARMADVSGIDPLAEDAAEKYAAAIEKVLTDVPELRGAAASAVGTGSVGNFVRKTGEAEDPDIARIKKNILG